MKVTATVVMSLMALTTISIGTANAAVQKKAAKATRKVAAVKKAAAIEQAAAAPAANDTISTSAAAPASSLDLTTPSTVAAIDTMAEEQSILNRFSASLTTVVWGPSAKMNVMRPGDENGNTPTVSDENLPRTAATISQNVFTENALAAGYKISKDVSVSGAANFFYTPVRGEHNAVMLDPTLKISHASLASAGNFAMNGDFRVYPGVTSPSTAKGQMAQFRAVQNPNYTLGRWNFALGLQQRYYLYDNSGAGRASQGEDKAEQGDRRYRIYVGPQANYTVSEKLTAWVLYEMEGVNKYANGFFEVANNGTDAEVGVDWTPLKALTVTPFLDIKTGGTISLETTTINLALVAKFL